MATVLSKGQSKQISTDTNGVPWRRPSERQRDSLQHVPHYSETETPTEASQRAVPYC